MKGNAVGHKSEIELSILGYNPLVYVVTAEEERFLKEVERICMHRRRKLWVHTISTGIYSISFTCVEGIWQEPRRSGLQQQLSDPWHFSKTCVKGTPTKAYSFCSTSMRC